MSCDHRKQHAGRTIRACPALLPVPQSGRLETKLRRERRLAQAKTPARCANIDHGDVHLRDTNCNSLALDPVHSLFEAGDDSAAGARLTLLGGNTLLRLPLTVTLDSNRRSLFIGPETIKLTERVCSRFGTRWVQVQPESSRTRMTLGQRSGLPAQLP